MNNNTTIPDFVSEIIEVGTGDLEDISDYTLSVIDFLDSNCRVAIYKKEK